MKTITLPASFSESLMSAYGKTVEIPVRVDWFPGLSEQQILENALARADGRPVPHPDPNIITVVAPIVRGAK